MAQVLIREIDVVTMQRLKQRAEYHGRSLEAELRVILNNTAAVTPSNPKLLLDKVRDLFDGRTFDDSTDLIRADRDR